jgi:hypothetical protein
MQKVIINKIKYALKYPFKAFFNVIFSFDSEHKAFGGRMLLMYSDILSLSAQKKNADENRVITESAAVGSFDAVPIIACGIEDDREETTVPMPLRHILPMCSASSSAETDGKREGITDNLLLIVSRS